MTQELKEQLIHTAIKLKKQTIIPIKFKISLGEFVILQNIFDNTKEDEIVTLSEAMGNLPISKPAVSQILNRLEKREYIRRVSDNLDHRKISLVITPCGTRVLEEEQEKINRFLEDVIEQMGKDQMIQLLLLLEQLSAVTESIQETKALTEERK